MTHFGIKYRFERMDSLCTLDTDLDLKPCAQSESTAAYIDFRLAGSESAAEREQFLGDSIRHGLAGDALEMVCIGLSAAFCTAPCPAFSAALLDAQDP
jgi:hypothetical protein